MPIFAAVVALLSVILLLCVLGILHTYLLYPYLVNQWARAHMMSETAKSATADLEAWPSVSVLMAVHNEEAVLPEKLATLAAQDYPGQLEFLIGSDRSTDKTDSLLAQFAEQDGRLHYQAFTERKGKPGIINTLVKTARGDIFVMTDAGVLLRPDTIRELVEPLRKDGRLGLVDATMIQTGALNSGIGKTETDYIATEVRTKRAEGRLWGAMIGPFGGCWAIRAAAFKPVPPTYLVDDFYLCMAAYEEGWRGLSSERAVVYESVGHSIADEYRRKVRIGSGNWQNLVRFRKLWWPPWRNELAFAFFSHKILRWLTPFLLIVGGLSWLAVVILTGNYWATALLLLLVGGILVTVAIERLLAARDIHCTRARALTYFLAMNAALLTGFYRYMKGIKTNVWQPSHRN